MVFNIGKTLDKEFKTWKGKKMTKHTQGPWETFDNGTDTAGIVRYSEDSSYNDGRDSIIICLFKEDGLIPTELAAQEANARLIAAAPELLAALENAVNMLRFHCEVTYSENLGEYMDTLSECDSAINKAKGE